MKHHFPGFGYPPAHLWAFICSAGVFIVVLADRRPILFVPEDPDAFSHWLRSHGVIDVRAEHAVLQARIEGTAQAPT